MKGKEIMRETKREKFREKTQGRTDETYKTVTLGMTNLTHNCFDL